MKRSTFIYTFHQDDAISLLPLPLHILKADSREEQPRLLRTLPGAEINYRLQFKKKKKRKKKHSWKMLVARLQGVGPLNMCYRFTICFYPEEQNTSNKSCVQKKYITIKKKLAQLAGLAT